MPRNSGRRRPRSSTLGFLEHGQNVLLRGPSGVGETTLAQNLGLVALQHGYSVRFVTLASALADLLKQESMPALDRRMRRYTQLDLLILDELGYLPCDGRSGDLLYNLISQRHEKRSTVISTNLPFKQWGTVFAGAACVAALVDRFVQHCHVLDIEADSWRQKQADTVKPRRSRFLLSIRPGRPVRLGAPPFSSPGAVLDLTVKIRRIFAAVYTRQRTAASGWGAPCSCPGRHPSAALLALSAPAPPPSTRLQFVLCSEWSYVYMNSIGTIHSLEGVPGGEVYAGGLRVAEYQLATLSGDEWIEAPTRPDMNIFGLWPADANT